MEHGALVIVAIGFNLIIFLGALIQKRQFSREIRSEIDGTLTKLKRQTIEERGTLQTRAHARSSFEQSPLLNPFWQNFSSTLVSPDLIKNEPLYSTDESSEIFDIENLMSSSDKLVSYSIWNAVPQILTSIGIIGTFASILVSLRLSGDAKIDEKFIMELVSALSSGFWSSLAGVGLAVIFIIAEKLNTKNITVKLADLNHWLLLAFPKLSVETILLTQAHLLENLSVDIQTSISNGFSEMTGGLGNALADVLDDETKKTIKDGVAASFIEMNAILADVRNESKVLTEELSDLKNAKKEMFENIKAITDEQSRIKAEINTQTANLAENLHAFEKAMAPLTEVAKQVQATNELSNKLITSVKDVSEASTLITTSITRAEEVSNVAVQRVSELSSKLSTEYSSFGENVESWVTQSNKSLENNLKEFDKTISTVLGQVVTLSNSFNTGVISLERTVNKLEAPLKASREA